eukprot:CAMPEP_0198450738 /NCGR_PEP_ID=MMETSP1453-20131121/5263_1 /TAXON_ID=1461543 ORGANISM="Unidentified sp., Strain RCC701" /NCGR_SAMPLE_ID=MMETSP1453 /ASSEMBLY_ACC=CAM_ASM_001118 /LENGTH=51 /DNA_ID=CAMNT_0044173843 /DNA_START=127 /DNA_END=278 /DNA_ORIENTATION=+
MRKKKEASPVSSTDPAARADARSREGDLSMIYAGLSASLPRTGSDNTVVFS